MGIEYLIEADVSDEERWIGLFERLDNPLQNNWPAFSAKVTEGGIYFCDHGRTSAAAIALRRIVDEALARSDSVTIKEAG